MKLESLALHHGYDAAKPTNAVAVPIYQTVSYAFDNTQHGADLFDLKVEGNIYTRIMNPTSAVLEQRMAAMEGGLGGLAVASGMSAITYALQCICTNGDNFYQHQSTVRRHLQLIRPQLPQPGAGSANAARRRFRRDGIRL